MYVRVCRTKGGKRYIFIGEQCDSTSNPSLTERTTPIVSVEDYDTREPPARHHPLCSDVFSHVGRRVRWRHVFRKSDANVADSSRREASINVSSRRRHVSRRTPRHPPRPEGRNFSLTTSITNHRERLSTYVRERMYENHLTDRDGSYTKSCVNPSQLPPFVGVSSMLPRSSIKKKLERN